VHGVINIHPFNLAESFSSLNLTDGKIKQVDGASAELQFFYQSGLQHASLKTNISDFTFNSVQMKNVELNADYNDKVLTISKISAEVLHGLLQASTTVDFRNESPDFSAQLSLSNANIPSLTLWLTDKFKLSGTGYVHASIKGEGRNLDQILQHLNGTINFDMNNGLITGDLAPMHSGSELAFKHMGGTIDIINGVMDNDNLNLDADNARIQGAGSINFAASTIHYVLQNTSQQPSVRLTVSGDLKHPDVTHTS
jgi:uncharacterized protein involved in outer membrane biogenesis